MDIDLTALRALVREKDISFPVLVSAIEQALLVAYQRTEGAQKHARAELDTKSGHVVVWANEPDEQGVPGPEFDDTPEGFGRIAATTARQVIVQRLRDLEDEQVLGEFAGREGDIVAGVIQQGRDPRNVMVDLGSVEGVLPESEQVPGERYEHGERLRCYVLSVRKGLRGPQIGLSRSHPGLVRKLFALEVPEIADGRVEIAALARESGPPHQDRGTDEGQRPERQGVVHRPDGPARAGRDGRAARGEDRHRRLLRRPGQLRGQRAVAGPGHLGGGGRRRRPLGPGDRAGLPAVAGHREGGAERPPRRQADRVADRHPLRTPLPEAPAAPAGGRPAGPRRCPGAVRRAREVAAGRVR